MDCQDQNPSSLYSVNEISHLNNEKMEVIDMKVCRNDGNKVRKKE
jgi:hypothetical protein